MNKFYTLLTLVATIVIVAMSGCTSDADLTINGAESRIFFYSELEANSATAIRYSTATGLADMLEPINPIFSSEFELMYREGNEIINPPYRYNTITGLFECPASVYTPKEGLFYHIESSLIDFPQLKPIAASTFIHQAKSFKSLEILSLNKMGNEFGLDLDLSVRFSIDPVHQYYEVVAYYVDEDDYLDPEKEIDLHLVKQYPGAIEIPQRSSILINSRENKGQYIDASIQASIPDHVLINAENILFKLKTVNQEHYMYHINVSKRYESQNAPLSEPVISYTNIENGLGLFSGYSSTIDTISF